jgi:flagellar basal-body rod protein FlgG
MLQPLGGSAFTAAGEMEEVAEPGLRQGMVEASNVTLSDEMTAMMATLRHAETGARLVTVYDELLGRAIQTLGQVGR